MDHYQTLGIGRDADASAIKAAYRKLASKHHPDKGGNSDDFKRVQEAYEVLSNPQKRAQYDNPDPWANAQRHNPGNFGDHPPGFDDIFSDFFAQHRQARQRNMRNVDSVGDFTISLAQAYHGTQVEINVGYGTEILNIPPGTRPGTKIRLPGKGYRRYQDLPAGDLIVRLHVVTPDNTVVENSDIYQHIVINSIEAILGVEKEITHISGKTLKVKVPAGAQHDTRLRLSGYGMPMPHNHDIKGNLYVIVNVATPVITNQDHINMLNTINKEMKTYE
jgi:curved DNA-binding protein